MLPAQPGATRRIVPGLARDRIVAGRHEDDVVALAAGTKRQRTALRQGRFAEPRIVEQIKLERQHPGLSVQLSGQPFGQAGEIA